MNCTQCEKLLPLYVSEDLPAREMTQVRSHLEACPACASEQKTFIASQTWWRTNDSSELFDEAFYRELSTSVQAVLVTERREANEPAVIEAVTTKLAWWFGLWRPLAFAATASLLLFAGLWFWRLTHLKGAPSSDIVVVAPSKVEPKPTPPPVSSVNLLARAPQRKKHRMHEVVAVVAPPVTTQTDVTEPALQPEAAKSTTADLAAAPEMLRIEMQTADPNIRIIWLTPRSGAAERE